MPPPRSTAFATIGSLGLVVVACGLTVRALLLLAVRCGDECVAAGASAGERAWFWSAASWQWEAQFHLAFLSLFASTLAFRESGRGNRHRTRLAGAAAVALIAAWTLLVRQASPLWS